MSFEGEISEIDLVQRLVDLGRERFTGAIRFENDGIIKIVYFKGGDILSASTNDRSDSIDEILFRAGKVTREHIKQALSKRKDGETLGDALLGLGFITRKELTWSRRVQVIGIIRSILVWEGGSWTIVADYLPKREEGTIFPLSQIILELIVTDPDRAKFERAMQSGSAVFRRVEGFEEAFPKLGLNEDAEAITSYIDGLRSAADVASASGKDIFNVYKLLEALRVLGLLEHATPAFAAWAPMEQAVEHSPAAIPASLAEPDTQHFTLEDDPPTSTPSNPEPAPATMPSWDVEPSFAVAPAALPSPPASVWDEPARSNEPAAAPASASEPDWGFDESQIEAARRGTDPLGEEGFVPKTPLMKDSKSSRFMTVLAGLGIFVLLAAGFWGGWNWWQGRQQTAPAPVEVRTRPIRSAAPSVVASTGSLQASATASGAPPAPAAAPVSSSAANKLTVPTSSAAAMPVIPVARTGSTGAVKSSGITKRAAVTTETLEPPPMMPVVLAPPPPLPSKRTVRAAVEKSTARITPVKKASAVTATRVERTEEGGASITNRGSAESPARGDGDLRQKYEGMARNFRSNPEGNFTLQIELVCETASITRALRGGANVWFVPTGFRGKTCYRIFWGHFKTHEAASAATRSVPEGLRGSGPVVVKVPRS